ncbi:hypothetical protein CO704_10000 [Cedecea neteri]|uniref:Uncharacterized protein n=2 Tax=Cedecea neteri TaxID=158822 RepID=A0A291DX56_9ENTR|nr:hypothetical protein CO704_10000 [Cedecea neteri]
MPAEGWSAQKMIEITERDIVVNDLRISGYSEADIAKLTRYLDDTQNPHSPEQFFCDIRLETAQALSFSWLVRHLRKLAEGGDKNVAVAALGQLVEIASRTGLLVNPELVGNKLR